VAERGKEQPSLGRMAAGLVDEIRIHMVDVLLGGAVGWSTSSRSGSSRNRPGSA
jgi:hypothetical protein